MKNEYRMPTIEIFWIMPRDILVSSVDTPPAGEGGGQTAKPGDPALPDEPEW